MITLSPKQRFLQSADNRTQHQSMVDRDSFDRAVDTALLEYQRGLCTPADGVNPAANYYRILGAQEIVGIIRNLAEVPKLPAPVITDNLNHKA